MSQLGLFDSREQVAEALDDWLWSEASTDADVDQIDRITRWYQRDAVASYFEKSPMDPWQLMLLATGTGKTFIAGLVARIFRENILALAHRDELVWQLQAALQFMTGEYVEVEKAELQSSSAARIVVASVQSMNPRRLERLGKDRFQLIITDEAHHAVAASYGRIYDYFHAHYGLGLTATADRADRKSLGRVFSEVAYRFEILEGILNGYLVPVRPCEVNIKEIDIAHVKASDSDGGLNLKELDEAMIKAVEGMIVETLRLEPNRHGIGFWPGKRSAEFAAMRTNALKPGSAAYISDDTPSDLSKDPHPDSRQGIVRRFRAGQIQYLHNCRLTTEGFDAPICDLVIHGCPTKSRALHAQKVGRGTRVLPGVIDAFHEKDAFELRRAAIAASRKPDLVCLDFVGNWGRHQIVSTLDVLGGSFTEAERKAAKKKQRAGEAVDGLALLEQARRELQALADGTRAKKVVAEAKWIDPFAQLGLRFDGAADQAAQKFGEKPISDAQMQALLRAGYASTEVKHLSLVAARRLLNTLQERRAQGLASVRQLNRLAEFGIERDLRMTFERARAGLNYCAQKHWRHSDVDVKKLHSIVYHRR